MACENVTVYKILCVIEGASGWGMKLLIFWILTPYWGNWNLHLM